MIIFFEKTRKKGQRRRKRDREGQIALKWPIEKTRGRAMRVTNILH